MNKKDISILFDNYTSEAWDSFNSNWEAKNSFITTLTTLIATEQDLASLEKTDTLAKSSFIVYVGENENFQERIDKDNGISFSTSDFVKINNIAVATNSSGNFISQINGENFKYPNRIKEKIKKLYKMGVILGKFKNSNDFYQS